MHWFLRMILDMPKAVLHFRKSHIMMNKLHKIEVKNGSIAGFKAMLKYPELASKEIEIYMDMLPEVMEQSEKYSPDELSWFLNKGQEFGVLEILETLPQPDDSWKKWEEQ